MSMNTYMNYALDLAKKGRYTVRPNPMVGCVIVHKDQIVANGYHEKYGENHAEINALEQLDFRAEGMDIYVTLEPCSHYGNTPPCVDAIIKAKPKKVIIASLDPNPQVSSVKMMREAGIEVVTGVCKEEANALNIGFFTRMRTGKPYVRLKLGTSLDGNIAMKNGESKWITGKESRADVQLLRASSGALISSNATVLADNPHFDVRDTTLPSPLKVIIDRSERITPTMSLHIFQGEQCFLTGSPVSEVLTMLAKQGINEVLIEAGGVLSGACITQGVVDELVIYQAPTLLGSSTKPMFDISLDSLADAYHFALRDAQVLGNDVKLTYLSSK